MAFYMPAPAPPAATNIEPHEPSGPIPTGPPGHWPHTDERLRKAHALIDSVLGIAQQCGNPHSHLLQLPASVYSNPSTPTNPFRAMPPRAVLPLNKAVHPPKFEGDVTDFRLIAQRCTIHSPAPPYTSGSRLRS